MNSFADTKTPRPLRCLVTGGLGYVGAWISERLAASGHEVFILSRGNTKVDIGQPYSLIQADLERLTPAELCFLLPEPLDCVVHAASYNESFEPGYARNALLVNSFGTSNLLNALAMQAQRHSFPLPLCVYLSTFHVYGRQKGYITEKEPPAPRSDYALTHYFAEEYCRMFARCEGLDHIILRISNGYGAPKIPGTNKWYLLLNDLCKSAIIRGEVALRSNPSSTRDFIWLGDLAAVVERLLHRKDLAGRVFNVSSGNGVSIGEVASIVAQTATHHLKRVIPVMRGQRDEDPHPPVDVGNTPDSLHVSNKALCSALDITFHNRMREEIIALLDLAAQTQTPSRIAASTQKPAPRG